MLACTAAGPEADAEPVVTEENSPEDTSAIECFALAVQEGKKLSAGELDKIERAGLAGRFMWVHAVDFKPDLGGPKIDNRAMRNFDVCPQPPAAVFVLDHVGLAKFAGYPVDRLMI